MRVLGACLLLTWGVLGVSAVLSQRQWELANDLRDVVELLKNETRLEICNEKLRSLEAHLEMKTKNLQLREELCNVKFRELEHKKESKLEMCHQRLKVAESEHAARLTARELQVHVETQRLREERVNSTWLQRRVTELETERRAEREQRQEADRLRQELARVLTRDLQLSSQLEEEREKSKQLMAQVDVLATQMKIYAFNLEAQKVKSVERETELQDRVTRLEGERRAMQTLLEQCQGAEGRRCEDTLRELRDKVARLEGEKRNGSARAAKIQHHIWRPQELRNSTEDAQIDKQQRKKLLEQFPNASFPVTCPGKDPRSFKGIEIMGKVVDIGEMMIFISHKRVANWTEAQGICSRLHMTPVELHDKQKFDRIDEIVHGHDTQYQYFLGASSEDRTSPLDFVWIGSGRQVSASSVRWRYRSPTHDGDMRCVKSNHFHPGQLYNWSCDSDGGYAVCQSCLDP